VLKKHFLSPIFKIRANSEIVFEIIKLFMLQKQSVTFVQMNVSLLNKVFNSLKNNNY